MTSCVIHIFIKIAGHLRYIFIRQHRLVFGKISIVRSSFYAYFYWLKNPGIKLNLKQEMRAIKTFTLLLLLFVTVFSYADNKTKIDSLEARLENISEQEKPDLLIDLARAYWQVSQDKTREYGEEAFSLAKEINNKNAQANASVVLSSFYIFSSIDKAKEYAETALKLARENNLSDVEIGALSNLGVLYFNQGDKNQAINYYQEALDKAVETNNSKKIALLSTNLGIAYKDLADYTKAIEFFQKSIDIREKTGDKSGIAFSLHMIGIVYNEWGDAEQALEYYNKSLKIKEELGDNFGIIFSMNALGQIYDQNKEYENALECFNKALGLSEKLGNDRLISGALNNVGAMYMNLNRHSEAIDSYKKSIEIKRRLNDNEGIVSTLENIGQLYLDQKKYTEAIKYFRESISMTETYNLTTHGLKGYKLISGAYAGLGNNAKALEYFRKYTFQKDSIFSKEKHEQIVEMQTKYETEKKEHEIALLNAEKEIKDISLKQQKVYTASLAIGLIVVLVFLLILGIQYKQKICAFRELVHKNQELIRNESNSERKYEKSNLQNEEMEKLVLNVKTKMNEEKVFLNPGININELSKELNTNSKYLSQAINSIYNVNFNNFVNQYRIKEAQKLLSDKEKNILSIEGIATSVGFNSKATFNTAFRKYTGVTPSFYKKSLQSA